VRKEFDYFNIELLVEDSCMFVAGGFKSVSTVERYDAWGGGWAAVAPLPAPRRALSLCALGQGSLYAVGGRDTRHTDHAEVYAYDVANDTWCAVAPMGTDRSLHGACSHGGYLYVVGGDCNDTGESSGERYDPVSDTWSAIAPLPVAVRSSCTVLCSLGEFVYVACDPHSVHTGVVEQSDCFKYHPATDTWNPIAALGTARFGHCMCALGGFLYAVGGHGNDDHLSSVERYDPSPNTCNTWSAVAPLNVPRSCASCVVFDDRLHVVGGRDGSTSLQSVERYDATANAWEVVPAMGLPSARRWMGGCSTRVHTQMNLFDKLLLERGRS
jgi:N-acetylneuraminic acid mutarotase